LLGFESIFNILDNSSDSEQDRSEYSVSDYSEPVTDDDSDDDLEGQDVGNALPGTQEGNDFECVFTHGPTCVSRRKLKPYLDFLLQTSDFKKQIPPQAKAFSPKNGIWSRERRMLFSKTIYVKHLE
jgi:hypothetical protein